MKKSINNIILLVVIALLASSCNDSFLDRNPTHDLNDRSYWTTVNDLKVYNNGIYNQAGNNNDYMFLLGFTNSSFGSSLYSVVGIETQTDNFASTISAHDEFTKIAAGQEVVPKGASRGTWKWEFLRRCNIFFANWDRVDALQEVKNRYAGEVYFFRAWFYLDKVQYFGDVPYVSVPLDTDSPELYGKRMPRKDVMDSVLVDINKACEFLPDSWDANHPDRVTKSVALALKSRICLYEGTFRKYHGLGDYEIYLNEAVRASEALMKGKYAIHSTGKPDSDYRTLFTSLDLSDNKEVIFCRKYLSALNGHRMSGYIVTQATGATKDFVEDFLCKEPDGTAKPYSLSAVYNDKSIESVLDNRDPRLTQTVLDPRKAGEILNETRFGFPRLFGMGNWECPTGYHFIKYYDYTDDKKGMNQEENDAPIFRYAEILLNYAEAKAELNTITQTDLDISINLLRNRVGMPHLSLNPILDPKYANEGISPLLVEIRRERRVELSFEHTRYQDLMRWKKGSYLSKKVLGMRFEESDKNSDRYKGVNSTVKTVEVNGKHYIDVFATSDFGKRVFQENKHYFHPLPTDVLSKNLNLKQNSNWE